MSVESAIAGIKNGSITSSDVYYNEILKKDRMITAQEAFDSYSVALQSNEREIDIFFEEQHSKIMWIVEQEIISAANALETEISVNALFRRLDKEKLTPGVNLSLFMTKVVSVLKQQDFQFKENGSLISWNLEEGYKD